MRYWIDVKPDDIDVDRENNEVNVYIAWEGNRYFTLPLDVFEAKISEEPTTKEQE